MGNRRSSVRAAFQVNRLEIPFKVQLPCTTPTTTCESELLAFVRGERMVKCWTHGRTWVVGVRESPMLDVKVWEDLSDV